MVDQSVASVLRTTLFSKGFESLPAVSRPQHSLVVKPLDLQSCL